MENMCRRIEEHLLSLHSLVNNVKDIGYATLCSNRRIPITAYNQAYRVNVTESEAQKLITDVIGYYKSMGVNPCFVVSPATRPSTFANSLLDAGFKLVLEEDAMVHEGESKNFRGVPDVNVVSSDGSLLDVWTDVNMKGFGIPVVLRDAFLDMFEKAIQYKGTKSYLGYFQGKPAGVCGLVSFNNVGGIFSVGTAPEYRNKGVATALLQKAIADSLTMGNSLLYLITTKGSDAERLYTSLGFQVAYTHRRYQLQLQKQ
ncbi:MAG: GNAT family N-acetyltransferase [Candidatus Bathyarchaeota archaeon]|nr:GNAT family N-acetyltransferase [Candidatus Bathyarchaeota archaeon]